jgi:hypothetical protein
MKQRAIIAFTIVAIVLAGFMVSRFLYTLVMHDPTRRASADTIDDRFIRDLQFEWGGVKVDPRRDTLIAAGHKGERHAAVGQIEQRHQRRHPIRVSATAAS